MRNRRNILHFGSHSGANPAVAIGCQTIKAGSCFVHYHPKGHHKGHHKGRPKGRPQGRPQDCHRSGCISQWSPVGSVPNVASVPRTHAANEFFPSYFVDFQQKKKLLYLLYVLIFFVYLWWKSRCYEFHLYLLT